MSSVDDYLEAYAQYQELARRIAFRHRHLNMLIGNMLNNFGYSISLVESEWYGKEEMIELLSSAKLAFSNVQALYRAIPDDRRTHIAFPKIDVVISSGPDRGRRSPSFC